MNLAKICGVVSAVALVGIVAVNVFAQDSTSDKAERREKLRQLGGAAAEIARDAAKDAIDGKYAPAKGNAPFKGAVIMLNDEMDEAASLEVNVGGLVILEVNDTQSRPTKFDKPTIEPGNAFQRMGRVKGVRMENGEPQMGGGYTWLLLRASKPGDATIKVSYTPNGGGETVTREHKVTVTE